MSVSHYHEYAQGFSLEGQHGQPLPANVHICGEAYSLRQGFLEGAVLTAEAAVEAIVQSGIAAERDAVHARSIDDYEFVAAHLKVEKVADTLPHSIAVATHTSSCLTYAEMNRQASALATYLRKQCGVVPGQTIAVATASDSTRPVTLLAIFKVGRTLFVSDIDLNPHLVLCPHCCCWAARVYAVPTANMRCP